MILAIDIGNTNIVVGCIDDEKTYFIERLSTVRTKTELEYAVDLKTVLDIYHIRKTDIEGCIISSVVPQITDIARLAAEKILKKEVMVLGPGVKTGLNIMMDNPGQLGADMVADAKKRQSLQEQLEICQAKQKEAVLEEDYEKAAYYRDEIKKIKERIQAGDEVV